MLDPAIAQLLAVEEAEARHVRWRRKTRGVLPVVSSSRLSLDAPPLPGLPAIGEGEREGGEVTGGEVKGYSQRRDGGKINKGRTEKSFSCSFGGVGNPSPSYVKQNDK